MNKAVEKIVYIYMYIKCIIKKQLKVGTVTIGIVEWDFLFLLPNYSDVKSFTDIIYKRAVPMLTCFVHERIEHVFRVVFFTENRR